MPRWCAAPSTTTLLRNDGCDFLNLGYYLERGDNTARLIDVKYYVLLPAIDYVGSGLDNYQWTTLLRAMSRAPGVPLGLWRRGARRARSRIS